jgi:PAS domain S-box-containing protein
MKQRPPSGVRPSRDHLAPLKVTLWYGFATAAWILLSDKLLFFFVQDAARLSRLQTAKGWFFVLVSGLLLYALVHHYLRVVQRREAELRASEERFRSVFLTAAAGMVVLNPDGRILQANPAFCRFIGYSEAQLLRMSIADVTHPEDRDLTLQNYKALAAGREESIHYEKRYLTGDGRSVWGHASLACLLGPDELPRYCIGLVQDIDQRKRAEAALRSSNRELEAFVYTVSHDLRSPLTPIIGYAEFLQENCRGRLDEQERECLAAIVRSGEHMLEVMEELLALAKVGQIERPSEPTEAGEVVREVLLRLNSHCSGVAVEVAALPALRVPQALLSLIFDNLIGNALRYGCPSGGRIEVGGERSGDTVRFYVRDHGPGIPVTERGRIFEVFCRGTTGRNIQGTGIGLATVLKIAQLFDGSAWCAETPGGGSTFWVELRDSPNGAHSPVASSDERS